MSTLTTKVRLVNIIQFILISTLDNLIKIKYNKVSTKTLKRRIRWIIRKNL
jgi:hypothetical protein